MNWNETQTAPACDPAVKSDTNEAGDGLRQARDALRTDTPIQPNTRAGIIPSVAMLRGMPLLQPLTERMLQELASRARIEFYARGEAIVSQGDTRQALWMLVSGRARAVRCGLNNREVLLDLVQGHGAHHGELSLIDGEPHAATLRCQTACQVLVIEGDDFLRYVEQSPALAQLLMQTMVTRLRVANRRISSLALQDVRERVISALGEAGELTDDGCILPSGISRTELASRIGASREMVSRVMKSLQENGTLRQQPDGTLRLSVETSGKA